ncbi:MAG: hypothetical protein C5B50_00860 [Verrucomicrobia bacterium]|nr:MAG: hypothetical protein C5B50_00860 [Verrucomicrobiota bacterium]
METANQVISNRAVTKSDKAIGAVVRTIRLSREMSQTELGEKIGVSFQQIQKYEKGTNRLTITRANQIAIALDVPLGDIIADSLKVSGADLVVSNFLTDAKNAGLIEAWYKIDPDIRAELRALIFACAGSKS